MRNESNESFEREEVFETKKKKKKYWNNGRRNLVNRNAIKDGRKKDVGKVEEHFQAERNKESNKISYDRTIQDMTRIRYRSSNIGKDFLIAEEKLSSTYRKLFRSESIPCFNCSKMYRFTMLSSRFPITSSVK